MKVWMRLCLARPACVAQLTFSLWCFCLFCHTMVNHMLTPASFTLWAHQQTLCSQTLLCLFQLSIIIIIIISKKNLLDRGDQSGFSCPGAPNTPSSLRLLFNHSDSAVTRPAAETSDVLVFYSFHTMLFDSSVDNLWISSLLSCKKCRVILWLQLLLLCFISS